MNSQIAKNGFKTFVVTLSVSLMLFGVLYYLVSLAGSKKADIESVSANVPAVSKESDNSQPQAEAAIATTAGSVFGDLATTKMIAPVKAVLGAADQSTQSTTPATGSEEITIGFVLSISLVALAFYVYLRNSRKHLMAGFEEDVTKDLT